MAAAAAVSMVIFVLWCFMLCARAELGNSQNFLHDALKEVLGPLRAAMHRSTKTASFRRRCFDSTACEFPFPSTELHEVAFKKGEIFVAGNFSAVQPLITELAGYHGGKYMHMQSSLVQVGQASDWIAGPKLNVVQNMSSFCQWDDPALKANKDNTHAVFLFPWETNNAFHALHDNVLVMLSTVILHYLTDTTASPQDVPRYTLYVFSRVGREGMGASALLYDLLPVIFGQEYVLPAKTLFRGGPHCVKHVSWGPATKPFYRDSLHDLRRVVYDVLQHIVRAYSKQQQGMVLNPAAQQLLDSRAKPVLNVRTSEPVNRQLKAIIVTRAGTPERSRRLLPESEQLLAAQLQRAGYATEICCNFQEVNTVALTIEKFMDVDICVGIHGAGLSNCIFGRRGMTIVELQTHHGFGVMSFPKLAHMSGGDYVFYDLRTVSATRQLDAGIDVPRNVVEQVVALAVKVHTFRNGLTIAQRTVGPSTISSIFGGSKSAAKVETTVSIRPIDGNVLHTVSKAISVVVLEPRTSSYYIKLGSQVDIQNKQQVQNVLNRIFGVDYRVHSMDAWIENGFKNISVNSKTANKLSKEKEMATIRRNTATYWVLFSPSTVPYTMESVLGPPIKESYASCVALPYYQFRQLTLLPGHPHRDECEQKIQLRRRMGKHDSILLTGFIN